MGSADLVFRSAEPTLATCTKRLQPRPDYHTYHGKDGRLAIVAVMSHDSGFKSAQEREQAAACLHSPLDSTQTPREHPAHNVTCLSRTPLCRLVVGLLHRTGINSRSGTPVPRVPAV